MPLRVQEKGGITMLIETPRLLIRPPVLADVDAIQAAKEEAWPELQLWMNWAYDSQKPRAALADYIAGIPADTPWELAASFVRTDNSFAVMSGLHVGVAREGTTGYWAARHNRGKGYATETTNALIRYAFEVLGVPAVTINYYADNAQSRRVIEKLGFTYTHTVTGGHNRCLDGTPLDVHHFVMKSPSVLPPLEWRVAG